MEQRGTLFKDPVSIVEEQQSEFETIFDATELLRGRLCGLVSDRTSTNETWRTQSDETANLLTSYDHIHICASQQVEQTLRDKIGVQTEHYLQIFGLTRRS